MVGPPKKTCFSFSSSSTLPWTNDTLGRTGRFQRLAEERSSMTTTSLAPASARAATRFDPIAPAPPVTRIRWSL